MILSKVVIFTTMDASNLTSNIINQVKLIMENLNEYNEYNWFNGTRWPIIFSALSSSAYQKTKEILRWMKCITQKLYTKIEYLNLDVSWTKWLQAI